MATIELRNTPDVTITDQLIKSFDRYAKYSLNKQKIEFIAEDNTQEPVLSVPVYYQTDPYKQKDKDPFFSFQKMIIGEKDKTLIPDCFDSILKEAKEIEKSINEKIPPSFPITIKKTEGADETINYSIEKLNIQSHNKEYWDIKLGILDSLKSKDEAERTLYIFYWKRSPESEKDYGKSILVSDLRKMKKKYGIKDQVWGYSQFLRDFLKKNNFCYELEIEEINSFSGPDQIRQLIELKNKRMNFFPEFSSVFLPKINHLLQIVKIKSGEISISPNELALLYNFDDNQFCEDTIFEKKFGAQMTDMIGNSHQILHKKDDFLLHFDEPNMFEKVGTIENKLSFNALIKNAARACVFYKEFEDKNRVKPDFVFLDDIPPAELNTPAHESYRKKIEIYMNWFPGSDFYYYDKVDFFMNESNKLSMFEKNGDQITINPGVEDKSLNQSELKNPLFIGIDIDWLGESLGFKLLKEYRKKLPSLKRPAFIFVFSRYESPTTIRRAIASGALFYITKQNFMKLVPNVYAILRSLEKNRQDPSEIIQPKYNLYENWHLLNKLEPSVIVDLKSTVIKGFPHNDKVFNDNTYKFLHENVWINRLPKADLHCHIGSCLGPDLLPLTSLLVLAEKYKPRDDKLYDEVKLKIKTIIDFVSILVNGLKWRGEKLILYMPELSSAIGIAKTENCLFEELSLLLDLEKKQKNPEEALLDPTFNEMNLILAGIDPAKYDYIRLRQELKRNKVDYLEIMLFFILIAYIRENDLKHNTFSDKIIRDFKDLLSVPENITIDGVKRYVRYIIYKLLEGKNRDNTISYIGGLDIEKFVSTFSDLIKTVPITPKDKNRPEYIKNLQSVSGRSHSLFTYLRGCEYGGSQHLQSKASILLSSYYIVNKYAKPDNIRYLTLRCAVDGYTKSKLIKSQEKAMEALLTGFNIAVKGNNDCKLNKKIHVDLILTAKRHKSLDEFKTNVDLALKYRYGLKNKNKEKGVGEDSGLKASLETSSFYETDTKVVSFDLAGLEQGNRAGKYYDLFFPLLKKCFPITIHAGEEDSHEAIWEAIYEVQSQRIGHGLTLRNNRELLDIVKDRHIAIELCPISNLLTREKNTWKQLDLNKRNIKNEYDKPKYYPLRQYLMENLDVTINTDNPFVSDCTLTKEFLVSAWLAGGLTKWEVLRLIKNGFRSAALPKEQKRLLMNEIDDEIYNILLQESL